MIAFSTRDDSADPVLRRRLATTLSRLPRELTPDARTRDSSQNAEHGQIGTEPRWDRFIHIYRSFCIGKAFLLLSKSEDILMAIPLYLTHCRLTHLKPDPCNVHLDRQARLLLYPHLRFAFLTLIFVFLDLSSSAHRPYAPMVTSRPTRVYSHSNAAPLLCAAWGEDSSTLLFLSQWTICFHPSRSACALGSRPQSTAPPENLKLGAA